MQISWDEDVPMSDGGTLSANVYRPNGTDRVPVIVTMGPYGKDSPMSETYPQLWPQLMRAHPEILAGSSGRYLVWEVPDPERWVPHGYAIAHLDARGTGRSPGVWSPMSAQEGTDFAEVVEWLAHRPWCSGKVGVLGVSYHAMAAWRVAERQPPHLAAIIPWYGAGDAFREAWRHGGILSNTFIDAWWYRWVRNQHGSGRGPVSTLTGEKTTGDQTFDEDQLESARADIPSQTRAHHLFDAWASAQAVDWSRVTVPFLSVGSLATVGLHLRGNVEAFRHAASAEKWLMLLVTQGPGIDRFYSDDGFEVQRRFFDHYLKDVDNDWPALPRVSYELREPDSTLSVHSASTWPPERARWTRLNLDPARRTMTPDTPRTSSRAAFWPTSDGVAFRSSAFERRTEVVGPLALRLQVATEAADLDLFASVTGLDAAGCITGPVTRGWLRLSHRELDQQASSFGQPVLAHRRVADVVAGRRYGVDLELWPASSLVPAGGSLPLTIRGIDADDVGQFRHNDPDDRPSASFAGWTTLYSDEAEPSWLLVPVNVDD